jgi:hypothetical protein
MKYEGRGEEEMEVDDPELDEIIRRDRERTGFTALAESSVEVGKSALPTREEGARFLSLLVSPQEIPPFCFLLHGNATHTHKYTCTKTHTHMQRRDGVEGVAAHELRADSMLLLPDH